MPITLSRALRLEEEWVPEVLSFAVICKVFYAHCRGNASPPLGGILVFVQSRSDLARITVTFKPRLQSQPDVRRGATVEINPAREFKRRSATPPCGKPFRGLKPTATVLASLREVRAAAQKLKYKDVNGFLKNLNNQVTKQQSYE